MSVNHHHFSNPGRNYFYRRKDRPKNTPDALSRGKHEVGWWGGDKVEISVAYPSFIYLDARRGWRWIDGRVTRYGPSRAGKEKKSDLLQPVSGLVTGASDGMVGGVRFPHLAHRGGAVKGLRCVPARAGYAPVWCIKRAANSGLQVTQPVNLGLLGFIVVKVHSCS